MPRRPERYLEERKQDILRAAKQMFVQQGYASTTISQIATEAEMATGTLYRYFESKDELIWAVSHVHIEEELQAFTTLEEDSSSAGDQLLEILLKPYQNTDVDQSRQDAIISMESTLAALRSDQLKEKVATDISMSIDALTELIQKAQAQGEVDPQFNASALSALLHGTASGLANLRPLLSENSTYIVAAQDLLIALVESLYSPSLAKRSQEKKNMPGTTE